MKQQHQKHPGVVGEYARTDMAVSCDII